MEDSERETVGAVGEEEGDEYMRSSAHFVDHGEQDSVFDPQLWSGGRDAMGRSGKKLGSIWTLLLRVEFTAFESSRRSDRCHTRVSERELAKSDSDSQNASARDYDDDVVETTPTDVSSANSTRSPGEVEVTDGQGEEGSPRRGKSPRVVISHLYDRLPVYSPTSREALLNTLPPRPAASQAVLVPVSSAQPSSLQPSASTEGGLVSLNSDDVCNHLCLLTISELEEINSLLTDRVEFQTRRSLGNLISLPTAIIPNDETLVIVVSSCSSNGIPDIAQWLFMMINKNDIHSNCFVKRAMIP
nr:pentatricopeptide repeat-containing protein At1g14470 [Ipomoea trifida]